MLLFWQLDPDSEQNAIDYALDGLLHSWIEDGFDFDAITEEEVAILSEVSEAIDKARTLPTCGERFDYLMGIQSVADVAFDIAHTIASTSFYLEPGERSVDLEMISGGNEEFHDETEQLDLPAIAPPTKKTSDLN